MISTTLPGLFIRPWADGDAPALAALADNINIYNNTCHIPRPYTLEHAQNFLSMTSPGLDFCIQYDKKAAGSCGLTLQNGVRRHSAEVGFWLGEPYWGRGILSAALPALTEYGFTHLGLLRIYGVVFSENKASARVFIKSGYVQAGVMRRYLCKNGLMHDCLLFEKIS